MVANRKSYTTNNNIFFDKNYAVTSDPLPEKQPKQQRKSQTHSHSVTSNKLIYFPLTIVPISGIKPPNHPIWDTIDAVLEKLQAESAYVSSEEDAAWLDEIRTYSSYNLDALDD
jgi:hypothetical protein